MSRLSDACSKELLGGEKLTLRCQLLKSWRRLLLSNHLTAVLLETLTEPENSQNYCKNLKVTLNLVL
jgi:hypothetical protein